MSARAQKTDHYAGWLPLDRVVTAAAVAPCCVTVDHLFGRVGVPRPLDR
jgi:hypothetical protein